jgi:hypothetical protein
MGQYSYSRFGSMCVAVGILRLHVLGSGRPDNLVLFATNHAPAVTVSAGNSPSTSDSA